MSKLEEAVTVYTTTGLLLTVARRGVLTVGYFSLPTLEVEHHRGPDWQRDRYNPWTFPTAWRLSSPTCGPLYTAWQEIEAIRERLWEAEREAESEARERCEIEQYKAEREATDEV